MSKILIVEHIHPAGEALLAREHELIFPQAQTAQAILSCVADCEAILVRNTRITAEIMAAAARTRVIGRHGVGYDTIDIAAATRLGIPVVYTPAANTESVAEIAMGFILLLGRKIVKAYAAMQSEELLSDTVSLSVMAQRRGLTNFDLWGKTLGIVGVGRIGTSLARKMSAAFQMKILGYDPYLDAATLAERGAQKVDRLEDLLPQCDFVSMHCPGGAGTRHLIHAGNLALFKPTAYLINTARGSVVDELALAEALRAGQLAGAAVDVYDPEPPRPGHPLLHLENAIVTPHFCAMTEESLYNMGTMVAQGILDTLGGRTPAYLVNPEVWPARRGTQ
jgi:D-3-phosphoglycerate dehydrogenase